ncbi:hypothetical protein [uncultured Lacinutrix sp.]|uniref:hypothetical protein n=1 Tax=uncultured Lacinutrix sp. TaxID=574032 RepID=UPI00260D998C|nr:hypothetical protein [uncultured Lacinutrix sp.]
MNNKNLHNIKNSGFKVPENYFSKLEDSIITEVKLKNSANNTGFKIPENYFDEFEVPIKKETKIISLFNRKNIITISSIAAAIVLLFSLNIFNNKTLSINDLNTETVDNYILDETNDFELADLFLENELDETQFIDYDISDDTLESYLESVEVNELFIE